MMTSLARHEKFVPFANLPANVQRHCLLSDVADAIRVETDRCEQNAGGGISPEITELVARLNRLADELAEEAENALA